MRSTRNHARALAAPALLLTAAATTHCAAEDMSGEPTPSTTTTEGGAELVRKSGDSRVTYEFLVAEYNEDLRPYDVHAVHLGDQDHVFFATPGSGHPAVRNFFWNGVRRVRGVAAENNWLMFEDHEGQVHHRASICDGARHMHTYPTWVDSQQTEVEVSYACVSAEDCERQLLCAARLLVNPTYCAAAAR